MLRHKDYSLRLAVASLLVSSLPAVAQLTGTNKPAGQDETPTLHVTSNLVIETVVVKDKQGHPIGNLTAKDFVITEDGVAQKIAFCEHQMLPENAEPLNNATSSVDNVKIYNRLARTQIAGEKEGEVKYKDKRLLVLYFDMTAMSQTDQIRALSAAQKFIRTNMTTADLVSIMRYAGGSVDVLQDFTADRSRILSILETLVVGEGQGYDESSSDDSSSDTGAAFGQDDAEFNIFNTDRQLSALQTAANSLSRLNEKKELIYFASGLTLNGTDNQAQLHATEQAALRAGVSFWPVDSRGLVAWSPMGDASRGSPGGQSMYTGGAAMAVSNRFEQSQDTLYALAGDTGGKALLDNNDLTQGIINAQKSVSDYYIVGYYTSNTELNGKFRKVKVTVDNQLASNLDYRQGYYAGKVFAKFNTADKERQLEDALMLGDPITDLTIALEVNYFQLNRAEYYVPIMVKIPGKELALAKKRGAEHTLIDFVGEIKDDYGGTTITNIRDHMDIPLKNATAAQLARVPVEYSAGYTVLPGKYTIKVLARDDETGRIGTFQTSFFIPNLNKELKHVPISSVVLSGERQAYKDAIYTVAKGKEQAKQIAADPLVQNGEKLIPSVTRVFNKNRRLYVYLQAYQQLTGQPASTSPGGTGSAPAAAAAPAKPEVPPVVAFVTLYQNDAKALETRPIEVKPNPTTRLDTAALNFSIDLSQVNPGKYQCQVTVLDPTTGKGTFWQAPIMVVE